MMHRASAGDRRSAPRPPDPLACARACERTSYCRAQAQYGRAQPVLAAASFIGRLGWPQGRRSSTRLQGQRPLRNPALAGLSHVATSLEMAGCPETGWFPV